MKTRVAINGFGRIGRNAFRVAFDRGDIEIVAINDLTDNEMLAHLLKYDTNYGPYHHDVSVDDDCIVVDGKRIPVTAERDPAELPWADRQVDVVIECTGFFTSTEKATAHITAGAKKVVISAPAKDEETQTVVLGANEHDLEAYQGDILSNASCTTNSLSAIMDVIDREFGVEKAMLTTVHSYTASQVLQDGPAKGKRESRAAAQNLIPTTTGAAIAVTKTVPSLVGKFDGMAVRVPTSVVSLSDVTMLLKRDTNADELNETLKKASEDLYYQGIIAYTDEELVSSDYIGNSHSGTVDGKLTNVVDGNLAKVVVWYDNEWGYSNRLVELVADVGSMLQGGSIVSGPDGSSGDDDYTETVVPMEEPEEPVTEDKPMLDPAADIVAETDLAAIAAEPVGAAPASVASDAPQTTPTEATPAMGAPMPSADTVEPVTPEEEHKLSVAYEDMGDNSGANVVPGPPEPEDAPAPSEQNAQNMG